MELEPEQLFLDDFSAGQTYPGQPRTMTKDDILSFAALTGDAHPIHYDDEYAKSTRFGRPIVHGLHLMALTALGATPLSAQLTDSMIAMLEQQATFRKPVFKDDTLRPQIEIEAIDRQPGKDWGKAGDESTPDQSARGNRARRPARVQGPLPHGSKKVSPDASASGLSLARAECHDEDESKLTRSSELANLARLSLRGRPGRRTPDTSATGPPPPPFSLDCTVLIAERGGCNAKVTVDEER